MSDFEISRPFLDGAIDRINTTVAQSIAYLGLEDVVEQVFIPEEYRAVIAPPAATAELCHISSWDADRLETLVKQDKSNRKVRGMLEITCPPVEIVRPELIDLTAIKIARLIGIKDIELADRLTAKVYVEGFSRFASKDIVELFDDYDLGSMITKRRSPADLIAIIKPKAAQDDEYNDRLDNLFDKIWQGVGWVYLGDAAVVESTTSTPA